MPSRDSLGRLSSCLLALLAATWLATLARAQCATQWLSAGSTPGTTWDVNATTTWDPDGAGPLSPRIVAGGEFAAAGNVVANNIALYDPDAGVWSALGTGMNGRVRALATLPNGDLVAGGHFTTAGGIAATYIARWARVGRRWLAASTASS
jgi:hypothetical protein